VAPKRKPLKPSSVNHECLVQEGTQIVEDINDTADTVDGKKPFYIVEDLDSDGFKYRSYWFKVRCRFCGDFFQLCPLKKNLFANLQNHLQGLKHSKIVADSLEASKSTSTCLSTGRRRRPVKSNNSVYNQQVLHD
jgi:hypothetical protein